MSGHSKWATIKHKKAALDAKRGKSFTRIIKEIMIAARSGGDADMNPRLRTAILAAKAASMPADNIKRAVQRGTGELEGGQIEEVMYEGYGPGGVAVLVMVATDNRNRTVSEIRHIFGKWGGKLGEQNSVSRLFERKSQILIPSEKATEEQLMNLVIDAGAEDITNDGSNWEILSPAEAHEAVLTLVQNAKLETVSAQVAMIPTLLVKLEGREASSMLKMTEALEENDDVQDVYANFDIDEKRWRPGSIAGPARMRVLGIDCGTELTGYGVIETDGRTHRLIAAGYIRTSTKAPLKRRLLEIARGLREVICQHAPECAAVEEVFYSANVKTALKLSHARGVALLTIAEAGLPLGEYSPLEVKTSVVGYGRAEKSQVKLMVRSLLGLEYEIESEDASDAVAVAICHATRSYANARMGRKPGE